MADKEERIYIGLIGKKQMLMPMTRQEAINKIGVALCVSEGNVDCENCIYSGTDNCKTQLKNWYLKDAEVVLNALLEVSK